MGKNKIFSSNLNFLMITKKISRKKLAKEMNVSYDTVLTWLEGSHIPKDTTLDNLSVFFDISSDFLLYENLMEKNIKSSKTEENERVRKNREDRKIKEKKNEILMKNLKLLLFKNDMTLQELSHDIHISYSTLANWTSGRKYPTEMNIGRLADYFGVEIKEIVGEEN